MASTKDMTLLPGTIVGCAKVIELGEEGQYPESERHVQCAPSPACGGGLGWGCLGRCLCWKLSASVANVGERDSRRSPTRLASLGTLPRKREREESRRRGRDAAV